MARKKYEEDPDDHNRWIVSYADFITLLFALFAVMYAISSLNVEKYLAISNSMMDAFSRLPLSLQTTPAKPAKKPVSPKSFPKPGEFTLRNPEPVDLDTLWPLAPPFSAPPLKPATAPTSSVVQESAKVEMPPPVEIKPPLDISQASKTRPLPATTPSPEEVERIKREMKRELALEEVDRVKQEMAAIATDIRSVLGPLIQGGNVTVTESDRSVRIEINASILFKPGEAKLSADSIRALSATARILAKGRQRIHVEGFTDSVPVSNSLFPSNWELSAYRAGAVVRLFTENGIVDDRLTAIGHGKNKPVDTNDTPQGRARNRRVSVSILSAQPSLGEMD